MQVKRNLLRSIKKIESFYTVRSKKLNSKQKFTKVYKLFTKTKDKKFVIFPRTLPRYFEVDYIDLEDKKYPNIDLKYTNKITLYPYQQDIKEKFIKHYKNINYLYAKINTGMGKTVMATNMIGYFKKKTLIFVPREALVDQWESMIRLTYKCKTSTRKVKMTREQRKELSLIEKKKSKEQKKKEKEKRLQEKIIRDEIEKDYLTVGLIDSKNINNIDNYDIGIMIFKTATTNFDKITSKFGFVIYDEAHMYCSKIYKKLYEIRSNYYLGLSATPKRPDGLDEISYKYLGKYLEYKTKSNIKSKVIRYNYACDGQFEADIRLKYNPSELYANYLKCIMYEPKRVKTVIDIILNIYSMKLPQGKSHTIIAFTTTRNLLDHYKEKIEECLLEKKIEENILDPEKDPNSYIEKNITKQKDASILRGGSTKEDIKVAKNSRIILATYQYASTGISFKNITSCVFITPKRNGIVQSVGRITRIDGDSSITRLIYDIVDINTIMYSQWRSRKSQYNEIKLDISIHGKEEIINKNTMEDNISEGLD